MKTIHRIMYESLKLEHYKKFCRNVKPEDVQWFYANNTLREIPPCYILSNAFSWKESPEKEDYWHNIWVELFEQNRNLERKF